MSLPQTFVKDENFFKAQDEIVSNVVLIETNPYTEPTILAPGPIQPDEANEIFYETSFKGLREGREKADEDYSENPYGPNIWD
jgi:hypothetical protein